MWKANMNIKYIGYYDTSNNKAEKRSFALSARNKMDYICSALNKIGYNVLIVSPSVTNRKKFFKGKKCNINDNVSLRLFPTIPWGNKFNRVCSVSLSHIFLLFYLLFNTNKDETIMVYHSLALRNVIRYAKKIRSFKMILEVEEIYQDVVECNDFIKKMEYKIFESANKYLFPTQLLNKMLNILNKPFAIVHGIYRNEDKRHTSFDDERVHVVYAGTFDPLKGVSLAAEAAEFLPKNYHIHIIGFGSENDTCELINLIHQVSKRTLAKLTYDGLLSGEEYINFLQKCHIGLSPQNPDAKFNNTSFPSKILSYMSNGLRVVSIRIEAIVTSGIGKYLYYYDEQTPKSIAQAIMSVDINDGYDARNIMTHLDNKFIHDMQSLLE